MPQQRKLTAKQEHFAQLVAAGSTQAEAYRQAYDVSPDASPVTAYANGSKLAKHTKVALRIQELQAATEAARAAKRDGWTIQIRDLIVDRIAPRSANSITDGS